MDLGKVKIERSENRKNVIWSKNYENRNFGKRKIRNRDRNRKSGNRFLSKTNENLRNRKKITHEKNYFQKDDQDGIQVQGILFSKLT